MGEFNDTHLIISIIGAGVIFIGLILWLIASTKKGKGNESVTSTMPEQQANEKGYPTYIWQKDGNFIHMNITDKVGKPLHFEAPMSATGYNYLCFEGDNDNLKDYDPRQVPIIAGELPHDLYDALRWPEVKAVYASMWGWWDKFKSLIPWLIVAGLLLTIVIIIDEIF